MLSQKQITEKIYIKFGTKTLEIDDDIIASMEILYIDKKPTLGLNVKDGLHSVQQNIQI